jgi:hypothetical protein
MKKTVWLVPQRVSVQRKSLRLAGYSAESIKPPLLWLPRTTRALIVFSKRTSYRPLRALRQYLAVALVPVAVRAGPVADSVKRSLNSAERGRSDFLGLGCLRVVT